MPKPRLIRALAYHHPGPHQADADLPTREMWVSRVPDGVSVLAAHPVFQLAPLSDAIRAQILHADRQQRILKEVRLTAGGPIKALIWHPNHWRRENRFPLVEPLKALYDPYRPQDLNNRFSPYDHWIGMTRDKAWKTGGGDRDHLILGAYVHLLEQLDVYGVRLPANPEMVLPDADVDALGTLAP